jgi:hypothetical protein
MIRSLYALPAMLCVTAVIVTAQAPAGDKPAGNPTTPAPSAQAPARPSESAANKATYTGCLKPGTSAGTWILESAEVAAKPGAAPSAVGTSGASKMTLNLEPASSVNLTPHANHKVEVVGIASPAKAGGDPAASAAPGGAQARQQFSVESVKMVSATCP